MELSAENQATLERIRANLVTFDRRKQARHGDTFYPEWCGVFNVDVEELLYIIDRLRAPDEPALTVGCSKCSAQPYQGCVDESGQPTFYFHAPRATALLVASGTGWPVP